ncbi:ABC transporter substrate-binding protein [bacterium 210820-DFI.6.37]|nr:ABC transporter substrate-binding protein [bacterium 210820-DFI.6.37]
MKKKISAILFIISLVFVLAACGGDQEENSAALDPKTVSSQLTWDHSLDLEYAKEFQVDYYKEGFALISISDGNYFLVVPEGAQAPEDLAEEITPLNQPLQNIYLVASASMDMFASIDAMDSIRFSALKQDSWYVEEAKKAMGDGSILYAGKYSAPDYELILAEGCDLAVENTMIFHTPEIKEQLEKFHIPVLVDYSSYETTPQGRMEWVKLYGALTGHEEKAASVFDAQVDAIREVSEKESSGQTVAFFYITSSGGVNVRKSSDYLPKMIDLAGGTYIFEDLGEKDNMASSTMTMQMEDFYAAAKDADYLIYNSSIEGELSSLEDFLSQSPLLEDFKAVKEGHVYCTSQNLYQDSMELGTMISDIYCMLSDKENDLTYLYRLK